MYNKEISLGNLFEAEALSAISKLEGYMPATEQQDRFEGTDLFYYGTRCDLTYNTKKGGCVTWFKDYVRTNVCDFVLGVRTHNGAKELQEPVLVICADTSGDWFLRRNFNAVVDNLISKFDEIVELGLDQLDAWEMEMGLC